MSKIKLFLYPFSLICAVSALLIFIFMDINILASLLLLSAESNNYKYMVDNSSVLIAFLNKKSGGTYNTVKYAVEKGDVNVQVKHFGKRKEEYWLIGLLLMLRRSLLTV